MQCERSVTVLVREGLHARPATQFVKLARMFQSTLEVFREGRSADAKSSVKLMLLAVKEDDDILIRGEGDDAAVAVESLARFVSDPEAGLPATGQDATGQDATAAAHKPRGTATRPATPDEPRRGIAAGEGAAVGEVFPFFPPKLVAEPRVLNSHEIEAERTRFRLAVEATIAALLGSRTTGEPRPQDVQIVDALVEVARDGELSGAADARILAGLDAASAALQAGEDLARRFEAVSDPYIRARAEDVRGVTRNVVLTLLGRKHTGLPELPAGAILVAEEISAWDLAEAPMARIAGILCIKGAATSHVAIMARTHGIPTVLGYGADVAVLRATRRVALDGGTGEVVLDPDDSTVQAFEARIMQQTAARKTLSAYARIEPRTRDGRLIEVAANLGSLSEIEPALRAGAMGVGLFRTELLFMERRCLPSEDEQTAVYAELAKAVAPRPVIVRTLDVGGDKPVAGIDFPDEQNPFLGWRGVRMCLDRPDIFRPQLRALLRASVAGNIKVMVPMIADVGELRAVKALFDECRAELEAEQVPVGAPEIGVMMETPAAALMADEIAAESAFFSIGTNDLTQYVMAADRLNPRLAGLSRPDHPAVLRAVDLICQAANKAGIWVGVCGEAAAREDLIPEFIRLGVTALSMSPSSIARAKKCVIGI